ncbi:MAG TPA: polymer-forming cytoskeletal protein [Thermomicrobiales bacterium]
MSIRSADTDYAGERASTNGAADASREDSYSVIDRHSTFDGTFRANRDLRIEGEVKGTIECQGTLFVAEGATVSAKVEAENITVAGHLNGEVRCQGRLQIMPSGQVRGKVKTMTLVINEGAYYEGELEMAPPEQRTQLQPASAPRILPPKPAGSSASTQPASSESSSSTSASSSNASTFIRRLGGPETPWEQQSGEEGEQERTDESSGS